MLLLIAAALGLSVFGWLAWHAVTVEDLDAVDSRQRFEDALAQLDSTTPRVKMDATGHFVRSGPARTSERRPNALHVLAYRASERRLVRAEVPLWFFTIKGPAAQYALQGTGFDLRILGLTASDLAAAGPGVVMDETGANGDRLLAWTQ